MLCADSLHCARWVVRGLAAKDAEHWLEVLLNGPVIALRRRSCRSAGMPVAGQAADLIVGNTSLVFTGKRQIADLHRKRPHTSSGWLFSWNGMACVRRLL